MSRRRAGLGWLAGAATIALIALAGCTSIPLSTLARLSTFDEKAFSSLDPAALRVRVTVPAGYVLDPGATELSARIVSSGDSVGKSFALEQVSAEALKRRGGLFSDDLPAIAYVLRLPDRSARAFRDLQKFVGPRNADAIDLKVAVAMKEVPAGATSMKVWIDLSLSAAQGYFTLVDGGTLHFDRTERFGKPPTP